MQTPVVVAPTPVPSPTTGAAPATPPPPAVVEPAPAVLAAGLFMKDAVVYFSDGVRYCSFSSSESYRELTGRVSTDGLAIFSTLPSQMIGVRYCFRASEGLFKIGADIYYSNGTGYCYIPSMEFFTARTGRINADGIREFTDLPIVMPTGGECN